MLNKLYITHFIINSVNFENGKKLQMSRGSIHKLRDFSDDICRGHNLSIVQPKEKKSKGMNTREYRAALKGDSWKFKLMNAVDNSMAHSRSKSEFIAKMQEMDYQVKWQDNRKYITYTTSDGKKCRDNKLHDDKYLKRNMEEFYEYRTIKGVEQAGESDRKLSGTNPVLRTAARSVGATADNVGGNRTGASTDTGENITTANVEGHSRNVISIVSGEQSNVRSKLGESGTANDINHREQNGRAEIGSPQRHGEPVEKYGKTPNSKGFKSGETKSEVGRVRSVDAGGIMGIANDIQNLLGKSPKPEKVQEIQQTQPNLLNKKYKSHHWDLEL